MHLVSQGSADIVIRDRDGARFVVDTAWVAVDHIELLLGPGLECKGFNDKIVPYEASCGGGASSDRLRIDGPWVVDLISGAFEPPLEALEILEGDYTNVELTIRPAEPGLGDVEEGDALAGASLDMGGTVRLEDQGPAGTGAELPFGLTLDLNLFSRFGDGLITIGDIDTIELTLETETWFGDLPLADCIGRGFVPRMDGVLRLESVERRACGDVALAIRQALGMPGHVELSNRRR
jgi:hypothetical protein